MDSSDLGRENSVEPGRSYEYSLESLEPDHMTPEQFNGMLRRHSWRKGEHRLLAAVLQDAVETFYKCAFSKNPTKREQFSETYDWMTEGQNPDLFSFSTICDVLDLDADCLREGLLTWLEQNRRRPISIGARYLCDPRRQVQVLAKTG